MFDLVDVFAVGMPQKTGTAKVTEDCSFNCSVWIFYGEKILK